MSGGNLNRKPSQVLINTLAADDVKLTGSVLSFKHYGNPIDLSKVTAYHKIAHSAGTLKESSVVINPLFPNLLYESFEFGLEVKRDYQFTGDPQVFYGLSKNYSHRLDVLNEAVSGKLAYADALELAGEIVDQVNGDEHAIVSAKLKFYISGNLEGSVAVADLMGNALLSGTRADAAAVAAAFNALAGFTAVADGTSGVWVTASEGIILTLTVFTFATSPKVVLTQKAQSAPFHLYGNRRDFTETITTAWLKEVLPTTLVQQTFPILPDMVGSSPKIPIASETYIKYVFTVEHKDAAGLTGASRTETAEEQVEFWIVGSVGEGRYWEDIINPGLVTAGLKEAPVVPA